MPPTEVVPAALPAFRDHLARVAAAGRLFPMRLEGTDTFRPLSPVVYVDLVAGALECAELQEQVRRGPVDRELQFPYHPHVTVAHGIADEAMDRAQRELADFAASWMVVGFALHEQGADGAWRMLWDYSFGNSPVSTLPHQYQAAHALSAAGGAQPVSVSPVAMRHRRR
jgi:2'-5' RNA ligase